MVAKCVLVGRRSEVEEGFGLRSFVALVWWCWGLGRFFCGFWIYPLYLGFWGCWEIFWEVWKWLSWVGI